MMQERIAARDQGAALRTGHADAAARNAASQSNAAWSSGSSFGVSVSEPPSRRAERVASEKRGPQMGRISRLGARTVVRSRPPPPGGQSQERTSQGGLA